jgi:hypothetical protein
MTVQKLIDDQSGDILDPYDFIDILGGTISNASPEHVDCTPIAIASTIQ